jgi:two-component system, chemotaxis family, chemotaxis protein CheY
LRGVGAWSASCPVVVVDDSLLIRALLRTILDEAGHVVVGEAGDGNEAVARVHEIELELVILDLVLPRQGGLITLGQVMEIAPRLPVIICCASLTSHEVASALQLGARGFIAKPFDRQSVLDALDVIDHRAYPSSPPPHTKVRNQNERRDFPRAAASLPVRLEPPYGSSITTRIVNVGAGELLIATAVTVALRQGAPRRVRLRR